MELQFTHEDCFQYLVSEIIDDRDLQKAAESGKKLRIKFGIDPTSPAIHIGRSIAVWRLRAFQEMGHEIHLIIGDFTGQIGDTSDKEAERPMLTEAEIEANLKEYEKQLWMILSPEKKDLVVFHHNSEWLAPLTFKEIGKLADAFSVNQFIKRELIAKRLEAGSRVSLREMLYPILQGYDSVEIKADVEIGGTDQRFNLLAGRTLQQQAEQPQQAVIMHELINGLDGRKMSSSWGNVISLLDTPTDKFGKMMRVLDELLPEYLNIFPRSARPFTTEELAAKQKAGENPRDLKMQLAHALVALYHGNEAADREKEQFIAQFSDNQMPEDMPEIDGSVLEWPISVVAAMTKTKLAESNSEARRLIGQGGVKVNGAVVEDMFATLPQDAAEIIMQVGKRKFIRIRRSL